MHAQHTGNALGGLTLEHLLDRHSLARDLLRDGEDLIVTALELDAFVILGHRRCWELCVKGGGGVRVLVSKRLSCALIIVRDRKRCKNLRANANAQCLF